MRKLPFVLRLVPLAAAALASVATSPMPAPRYSVTAAPEPGETAVAATIVPEIRLQAEGPDAVGAPDGVQLLTEDGGKVGGTSERTELGDGVILYRFHPDAPLAQGEYFLQATGHVDCYEPVLDVEGSCDEPLGDDSASLSLTHFSTFSNPSVLGVTSIYGRDGYTIHFSQPMDATTIDLVHVLDASGEPMRFTPVWTPAEPRVLELRTAPGNTQLVLDEGIIAADGTPLPGLPLVY